MSQELQFSDEYNKISVQDQCESEDICEEEKEIPMPSQELFLTLQREIEELKYQNKLLKKNHQTYVTSSKSKLVSEKPSTALTSDKQYSKASATKKGASKLQSIQQNKYSKTTAKLKSASLTPTESLTVQQKNSSVELQSIGIGIIKPAGNYIDIPESLSLTKEEYNAYKSSVRDLVEAFVITDITWAKQEKKVTLKLIEKFKASNPQFPNTAGDWAVKLMIKRVINNKRAYQRIRSQQEQGNDDNSDGNDHHSDNEEFGNQPGKRVDRIDTNDIRIDHDKDDIHVHNEDDTCDIAQKNNDGSAGDQLNKNGKRVAYNEDDRRITQKNSEESASKKVSYNEDNNRHVTHEKSDIDNQRRVAADDTHDTCTPAFKLIVNLPDSSEVSNTKKKPQNSRKKNETQRKKNNRRK